MLLLGAFFMISACMLFIEKNSAKYLLMSGIYLLVSWWNVLGWANLVLSEALSTTFLFFWLASLLVLFKKGTWPWWFLHSAVAVLFSFTRDSWPYMLVAFYGGLCLVWILFKQPGLKKYVGLLILGATIFLVQQHAAKVGLRYRLPVINAIVVRILPNAQYTQWFEQQGMPCAEKLQLNFGHLDVVPEAGQHKLWALYSDTAYQPFLNWVVDKGQPTYTRFLLTHPAFLCLTHETPEQLSRVMSYNLFYIDEPRGYTTQVESLFPLFNIGVVAVLCIMLLIFYTRRRVPVLLGPAFLSAFTLLNAVLSYNADALEVERHLFITNILVQLMGFWSVALIWDSLQWKKRVTN